MWKFITDVINSISSSETETREMESEENIVNGLCFTVVKKVKCNVPVEILCNILKYVDEDTLVFKCRLVCKQWRDVIESIVLDEKARATKRLLGPRSEIQVPWWVCYSIIKYGLFRNNLIKNHCGQENFKYWDITQNGGDHWLIETDQGNLNDNPLPNDIIVYNKCFTSSFGWCSKQQIIKLSNVGLTDKIMDEIQPEFECCDWVSTRFDCGGVYGMQVILLDINKQPLMKGKEHQNQVANNLRNNHNHYQFNNESSDDSDSQDEDDERYPGNAELILQGRYEAGEGWLKMSGVLKSPYPKGARYLSFFHKGIDTQFWKGHYGVKITGSLVRPVFPKEQFIAANSLNSES